MTFQTIENSNDLGQPIFLYEFALGPTTWRYNSSAEDILLDGATWYRAPISDDGVSLTGETASDLLTVTTTSEIGPVQAYAGTPPSSPVLARLRHYHSAHEGAPIIFVGEISQVDFPRPGQAQIKIASLSASHEREGLRLGWQRTCPHALYDPLSCKVNKAAYAQQCVITDSQNGLVQATEFALHPNGYFDGGFLEWDHPIRGTEFRAIESHSGNTVRMFGFSDGLTYGMAVRAYPGCKRTPTACQVFENYDNYGGIPHMPGKSPFDGNPIF